MIYLMRHGQDDETFIGGWSKGGLIPEGKLQVAESALWIKENLKIKEIRTSDIERAVETSRIVGKELGIEPIKDELLREQNKGLLNGRVKDEAMRIYPEYSETKVTTRTRYPNGESLEDLYDRVKKYIEKIQELKDGTLLVTHRGFINMLYYILNEIPLDMDKNRFGVVPATVHELDQKKLIIRKVR